MCGRIATAATPEELAAAFEVTRNADILELIRGPRYNVGPQSLLAAIRTGAEGEEWAVLRWGLVPSWASDPQIGYRTINARSETVEEKPAFREAFRRRRCLIPISGFYEWKKEAGRKQPYYIRTRDGGPFTLAGLWERRPGEPPLETCTILTTQANALLEPLHDRMPVIVGAEHREAWLHAPAPDIARELLRPYAPEAMQAYRVDTLVNNARNDVPECVEPIDEI